MDAAMRHRLAWSGRQGEQGAIALVAALSLTAIMGMAALAVDLGALQLAKRHLQAATDAAALAATYGLTGTTSTTTYAGNYLGYNGYPATSLAAAPVVTTGRYCPIATIASAARFTATTDAGSICPGDTNGVNFGTGPNAVQVTAHIQSPLIFGRILLPNTSSESVSATATATQIDEAGFTAGTGLVSVNMGVVNPVLSSLLGGTVSLSAVSYSGLVQTNITALDFLGALATQLNVSSGTYGSLLTQSVTIGNLLSAAITALNKEGTVGTAGVALGALQQLQTTVTGSGTVALSQLLSVGVWQNQAINSLNQSSALNAGLNLYSLVTLAAQLADGQHAISISGVSAGIAGVGQITGATSIVEQPQAAFGPVGASVHTAQVRLQLQIALLNSASVLGSQLSVTLPIYVEAAEGNATLTSISCGPGVDTTIGIDAQTKPAVVYVGQVSSQVMNDFTKPVTPSPAQLANLNVALVPGLPALVNVNIVAAATTTVGAGEKQMLFDLTANPPPTEQSVSSGSLSSTLLQSLVTSMPPPATQTSSNYLAAEASVAAVSLSSTATNQLVTSTAGLLTPVASTLDPLVDSVLAALGIKLGYMDVTATGSRCGVPALVL